MVNKLLWEAQPPIAMSTTRGTVVRRPISRSLLWSRGAHMEPCFPGSILWTRGAHMEPHPLDDSCGLVVLAKSPIPGMM